VPEKREEVTTEGGLDVAAGHRHIGRFIHELGEAGIRVSLFVDPDEVQLAVAAALGAPVVELHTGAYCDAQGEDQSRELDRMRTAAGKAAELGLECHAGHGLSFDTVGPIAAIATIAELNIGHFLVGESIFGGLESSIKRMRALMDRARAEASSAETA
jgi:pyridoxine 5-phosphate synthase